MIRFWSRGRGSRLAHFAGWDWRTEPSDRAAPTGAISLRVAVATKPTPRKMVMTKSQSVTHIPWCSALRLCALLLTITGCSLVRPLSPQEYDALQSQREALVLFRLTGTLDNKAIPLLVENLAAGYADIVVLRFGLANLDMGEPITSFAPVARSDRHFSPSLEAARDGWGAFMLPLGSYYLRITAGDAAGHQWLQPSAEFRFILPPNTPFVYIGSLHLACATKESASWFGGRDFASCRADVNAAKETEAAHAIARTWFKEFGQPVASIMQRYGAPLPPGTIAKLAPVGLLTPASKIDLGSPEWMARALAIGLAPSAGMLGLASGGGGPGAGAIATFAILWAPIGTALGYLGGRWSESDWQPCRQALQESLGRFDPAALAGKLKTALNDTAVHNLDIGREPEFGADPSPNAVKSILNVEIHRVALRLCPTSFLDDTLCLEIASHVRLYDAATRRYVYDLVIVYANGKPSADDSRLYERVVTESAMNDSGSQSGRALDSYCGTDGGELLLGDISRGLDAIVNKVVEDLALSR